MFRRDRSSTPGGAWADRIRQAKDARPALIGASGGAPRIRCERQSVFRSGLVILGEGARHAVAIKNISRTGARIEFFTRMELPREFVLVEPTLRLRARVRVVWRRDGIAGLAFVVPPEG